MISMYTKQEIIISSFRDGKSQRQIARANAQKISKVSGYQHNSDFPVNNYLDDNMLYLNVVFVISPLKFKSTRHDITSSYIRTTIRSPFEPQKTTFAD